MIITKKSIRELEYTYGRPFSKAFKQYLLVKYSDEPFPYEYSEQDLYFNIKNDIRDYETGKLDITVKSPSERWQEEREYLRNLCVEKLCEIRGLKGYIAELEQVLVEHDLESSRMIENKIKSSF